jgi:hypothetical protein
MVAGLTCYLYFILFSLKKSNAYKYKQRMKNSTAACFGVSAGFTASLNMI